jgi:NOL1/NOP2/fmu family ribosome biogenesis protein
MAVGFMIGQQVEGKFVPSHELITRFWPQFVEARLLLTEEQSAIWLAGRDLRDPPALPYAPGAVILLQDDRGRFLGRGKLLRDRIRNLLPKRITRI